MSRIWDPFVKALPNFTKLELPKNLEQIDNIPINNLILKLRGLRRVKVEDTSWPLWVYILINLGVSMVITGLLFWYFQYYKKGKHSFNCLSLCLHKATSDRQGDNDKDEPTGQMELVSLPMRGTASLPPGEEDVTTTATLEHNRQDGTLISGRYENDSVIRALYPILGNPEQKR